MKHTRALVVAALTAAALASALPAQAGGPFVIFRPGQPYLWPGGGANIPFNPDQGGLGPLDNAGAVAQTTAAFQAWADVASATATYANAGALPIDVDETNFAPFFASAAPDGLSVIVYDEDGAIFTLLFGADSGVLAFAGPEWLDTTNGTIVEGLSFMNGGALLPPNPFPVAEMLSVQVHEFGHYSNLDHTVVNGQVAGFDDTSGPTPFNTFPLEPLANRIETMYPFLFVNGGQATPHRDDIGIFSTLYAEPTFADTTASISGRILGPNRTTPLTGVNVIARNVANPYDDAVSAISSNFTNDYAEDAPLVGRYRLRGLTPGASYVVFVDQILAGGFSTPPRVLPNVEELYNGADESSDPATDDPSAFTPVSAAAGATAADINVVFNRIPEGPLAVGDDGFVELFPSFRFKLCGQSFSSVFVNANGNLTFGNGDSNFIESIREHLAGPPRIAALWDDLNPSAGGTVAFEEDSGRLKVTWTGVPEYPSTGANTFRISLFAKDDDDGHHRSDGDDADDDGHHGDGDDGHGSSGNRFSLRYGSLDATDGLAGMSCGGRVTNAFEKETDLRRSAGQTSRTIDARGSTAVFEIFTALDNDLDNYRISFAGTSRFRDDLEPNGTFAKAERVKLPYTNADRFAEIRPRGGDVDFYKFRATAGDILVVETVPGNQVDTMIGLFDAAGTLLAFNDDGGAFGVGGLSRFAVIVPATAKYFVGVTTWPDFGFTGAGQDFGRYVLAIHSYRGTLLPLVDDESVSVPLGFAFPFQGAVHTDVFVSGNGNLTFGVPRLDFIETVGNFLAGPPRIAALWDDLFPGDGLVIAEQGSKSLTIHFASVPEFLDIRPNYFSLKLEHDGDVDMRWFAVARGDALVGVTPGGRAVDPGPVNLSRDDDWPVTGTTYEVFTQVLTGDFLDFSNFDLMFRRIEFEAHDHHH
jgi:hypothetical protein